MTDTTTTTSVRQKIGSARADNGIIPIDFTITREAAIDSTATNLVGSTVKRVNIGGVAFDSKSGFQEFADLVAITSEAIAEESWGSEPVECEGDE